VGAREEELRRANVELLELDRRYVAVIEQQAERLRRLVGDLLDLSRIDAGTLPRRGAAAAASGSRSCSGSPS
jgi:signal transduction histidine kinase